MYYTPCAVSKSGVSVLDRRYPAFKFDKSCPNGVGCWAWVNSFGHGLSAKSFLTDSRDTESSSTARPNCSSKT